MSDAWQSFLIRGGVSLPVKAESNSRAAFLRVRFRWCAADSLTAGVEVMLYVAPMSVVFDQIEGKGSMVRLTGIVGQSISTHKNCSYLPEQKLCIYVYMYICIYVYIYMYICVYVYVYM